MKKSVSKKQTISLVVLAIVLPAVAYGVVGYFMGLPPFEKDSPYGEHTVNYEKSDAEKKVESALKDDPSNKLIACFPNFKS